MPADIYLKFEEPKVEGESQDEELKGQIECASWNWGESQPSVTHTPTGLTAGRVQVSDMSISKLLDKSSPKLMEHCATGKTFGKVTLVQRKAVGKSQLLKEFITITLETVLIASYSISGTDGGGTPIESITLHFVKFKFEYKVDNKGTLTAAGEFSVDLAKAKVAAG